jgi:hypothetical protein
MKTTFTLGFLLLLNTLSAQGNCTELFISEYVEGWSNNKALEIYNPTSSPIDLSAYFVARYSNGSSTSIVANSVQLSGIVPAHDVFVAVLDKRDPNGTELEAPIWDSLEVRGDGFFTPVYNTTLSAGAFYWNGNDAIVLAKGTLPSTATTVINPANVPGFAIVDIFGKIGQNPANELGIIGGTSTAVGAWSSTYPHNTGAGVLITKDHSMLRKATIQKGETTNVAFFDPLLEWDSIPAVIERLDANGNPILGTSGYPILDGNWTSLGTHECQCNPASIDEASNLEILLYPNPSNGVVYLKNSENIRSVEVLSALGQRLFTNTYSNKPLLVIDINGNKGVYFLKITMKNGAQEIKRVIIR